MSESSEAGPDGTGSGAVERSVTLPADLHARPAGEVSRLAATFDADMVLECGGRTAMAASVLLVMGLGARTGATVTVRASGPDAGDAVEAVAAALRQIT